MSADSEIHVDVNGDDDSRGNDYLPTSPLLKKSFGVYMSQRRKTIDRNDVPPTIMVEDEEGKKMVELDDEKMALFMAMLTYFSSKYVDDGKSIERQAKTAMTSVLNSNELVSSLIRPDTMQPIEQEKKQEEEKKEEEKKKEEKKKKKSKSKHDRKDADEKPSKHRKTKSRSKSIEDKPKEKPMEENKHEVEPKDDKKVEEKKDVPKDDKKVAEKKEDSPRKHEDKKGKKDESKVEKKKDDKPEKKEDPKDDKKVEEKKDDKPEKMEESRDDKKVEKKDDSPKKDDEKEESDLNSLELDPETIKLSSLSHSRQPSFESAFALSRLTRDDSWRRKKAIAKTQQLSVEGVSHMVEIDHVPDDVAEDLLIPSYVPPDDNSAAASAAAAVPIPKLKTPGGLGPCELVWGPACYQAPLSVVADNTMFMVRYRNDPYRFIIAIAGTHPLSLTNWFVHDMNVKILKWPYTNSEIQQSKDLHRPLKELHEQNTPLTQDSQPGVTGGTLEALRLLLAMRDPDTGLSITAKLASEILEYHKQLSTAPCEVTVVGHSLGGALCTVLALFLECTRDTWDPRRHCVVKCISFASPTVGNGAFADMYDSLLGSRTKRIHNNLDIVSLAWELSGVEKISTLYEPMIHTPSIMSIPLQIVRRMAARKGYKHVCADHDHKGFTFDPPNAERGTNFMNEVIWQHNVVYFTYFGFDSVLKCFSANVPLLASLANKSKLTDYLVIKGKAKGRKS